MKMSNRKEVAEWMLSELKEVKNLDQEVAVYKINQKFGDDFVYQNENGNLAIDKGVLKEFRKLTEGMVVWGRGYKQWRFRKDYDPKDSRQVD